MDVSSSSNKSIFSILWRVSLSLMISYFSMTLMLFVDRLYLANYSEEALAATASIGTLTWALTLFFSTFTGMSEIFVAQANGAKSFMQLGAPVWQMIWLSLFSVGFFVPIAIFGSSLFQSYDLFSSMEIEYFYWALLFSPLYPLLTAMSGFFIGQGKTSLVQWLAVGGNAVNILLDPLLIFGVEGVIPSLGIAGAIIATATGILVQVVTFFAIFISKKNRTSFGTNAFLPQKELFIKCIKIGAPPAFFILFEMLGWAIFYWMMAQISKEHVLVASICSSILLLLFFFGMGLEKGVAAIAGNFIGARQFDRIGALIRSGSIMIVFFSIAVFTLFTVYPDSLIDWFFKNPETLEGDAASLITLTQNAYELKSIIKTALISIGFYLIFENIRWMISGVLTAAGDTLFLMLTGVGCVWVFMLIPTYCIVVKQSLPIIYAFYIWIFYSAIASCLVFFRYRQGKWKEHSILDPQPSELAAKAPVEGDVA